MFINVNGVRDITGIEVDNSLIIRAQHVLEAYVGRNESEVTDADDVSLMAKAVAFQAVYMKSNYDTVYQQVALIQMAQIDGQVTLDRNMAAPFIAPLAVLTVRNLSWRRSRSVKTGSIFAGQRSMGRWETQ